MQGVEIKKTYPADFERVYPLLQTFDSPYSKETWQKIFTYRWDGAEDYVGFHLEKAGQVVGFMGLIFSRRYYRHRHYTFCNITSLIVEPDYRAVTIFLLRKLKSLDHVIFTGLRPIQESYRMLTMMGFRDYETAYNIIPTLNYLAGKRSRINMLEMPQLMDEAQDDIRRIAKDHAELDCDQLLFTHGDRQCLLIYKNITQAHYKLAVTKIMVLYISDSDFFNQHMQSILACLNKKYGIASALYIDERFVSRRLILSFKKAIFPPRICYNPFPEKLEIDEIYSEAVLL